MTTCKVVTRMRVVCVCVREIYHSSAELPLAELRLILAAVALALSVDSSPTRGVAFDPWRSIRRNSPPFVRGRLAAGFFDIVKRAAMPPTPAKGLPAPLCRVKSHEFGLNQYASVIISPASLKTRNAGICRSKFNRSHSAQTDAATLALTPFLLAGFSLPLPEPAAPRWTQN